MPTNPNPITPETKLKPNMAKRALQTLATLAFLAFATAIATSSVTTAACNPYAASAAQGFCNMTQDGLSTCRPAITGPKPTDPTTACCSALEHADFSCLCSYKNSGWLTFLKIDPNLAMQLPAKCNLPSLAKC